MERFQDINQIGGKQHAMQTVVDQLPVINPCQCKDGYAAQDDYKSHFEFEQIINNESYADNPAVQNFKRHQKKQFTPIAISKLPVMIATILWYSNPTSSH